VASDWLSAGLSAGGVSDDSVSRQELQSLIADTFLLPPAPSALAALVG